MKPGKHPGSKTKRLRPISWLGLLLIVVEVALVYRLNQAILPHDFGILDLAAPSAHAGDVIGRETIQYYSPADASKIIRRNYTAGIPGPAVAIEKITFRYRSQLPSGEMITIYARAYLPDNCSTGLPTFAFAPGTTGIGDQCAASLEKPATANWGDYDAHMMAYASEGYAAVTTDYEGMRDPSRIHHYMVGELEGRALLDSVRALRRLPEAHGRLAAHQVVLSGYSQGGHAAFWADKIAAKYSPDVHPLGIVGFGPVMSVKQTLTDITHGANLDWFGPHVIYSYEDYYKHAYPNVLLPNRYASLAAEVTAHCIDSDINYWGRTPANIYTPEFVTEATAGALSDAFGQFSADLDANTVGAVPTTSAKLINNGAQDIVVLPAQQTAALPALCASSLGPVQHVVYPAATHYDTMLQSFSDTLAWMHKVTGGDKIEPKCQ